MQQEKTVIAELDNVTKIYRKRKFVGYKEVIGIKSFSLKIYRNEIFGLLGLNGSGKTTTIKLLLGLLYPDSGRISICNTPVPNWQINRVIGYLPEAISFNKKFSGWELLKFYSSLFEGIDTNRIVEIVDFVKLSDSIHRKVGEYSKGMVQRLGLAQALIHDPEFLILDEPTSGLDPLGIKEIRDLILKLKEKNKTIFFSSHLISELEKVCDRVGIIHEGKLVKIVEHAEWQSTPLEEIFIKVIT